MINKNQSQLMLEIQWARLLAIVDEVGAALQRTCFSTIVREGNDFACVLMDAAGDSIVQSSVSIPSFIGTLPITCKKMIKKYAQKGLQRGDVIITNDPWSGAGHLPDLSMITPIFNGDNLVAFAGSIVHLPDIGGGRLAAQGSEVYEEGLRIPFSKLMVGGEFNETLADTIYANVRVPDQVLADIQAQITANELGSKKVEAFLGGNDLKSLDSTADEIKARSESAIRKEIAEIPDGKYRYSVRGDAFEGDFEIAACVEVNGETICVDYSGTSPQIRWALNSVYGYTYAYTVYPLKCLLDPDTPNNQGCFRPISVTAPEGSILNPRFPAAVNSRNQTGHLLQAVIFGALADVIPERIQADSGVPWIMLLGGRDGNGYEQSTAIFLNGGQGARFTKDGNNALVFPTNGSNTPIEITETQLPLIYDEKSLIPDSGGAGRVRGGCGERVVLRCTGKDRPVTVCMMTGRIVNPPHGFSGGQNGRNGSVWTNKNESINPMGRIMLENDEMLVLEVPGGGGLGDPYTRDIELIRKDVSGGYVSREQALQVYGVSFDPVSGNYERK